MDALSEVFRTVHLESTACYRVELSTPWGIQMSAFNGAVFLVVVRGSGWLEVEGIETPMPLVGGDVVFLPKGQRHALRDSPLKPLQEHSNHPMIEFDRLLQSQTDYISNVLHIGGAGLSTTVMYGRFCFTPLRENPLLSALPPLLIVKGEEGRTVEWLDTTLQFMASEMATTRPGAQTVINHLASILLVQAVRAYIANRECGDRCWLKALTDPVIGSALNLIHRYPDRSWTVEELAEQVGISRTTFFTQFRELVGEPPSKYLTRWRMQRASQILRLEHMTLNEVASLVGYESEASFSKAFKQWMGQSPGAYRQQMLRS
ncbi:AraC family transcriptional regulator [Iningainema tapete]|uniref:AraC family transcriptional regulator n=1 Tax=Iningainema tapete BLCC-T55 TaxID=2748662 RepID=A0A8J6XAZ1_9CYAN|nr:AraC family transcriptional regulator [Iningainema tapete]MBD2771650.1 AraC family transcriptional regulator [Iningainema tapete BLCC-T55]